MSSCRLPHSFGFYQPITMNLDVPEGPPEYKAGWYAGCNSAIATKGLSGFANGYTVETGSNPDLGNGIYQHDPVYQTAWGQAWFACRFYIQDFVDMHTMQYGPLQ